jgi:hypothetical protein
MASRIDGMFARRAKLAAQRQTQGTDEPIEIVARHSWHHQASIVGHGFRVRALRCGDRQLPGRMQIKPIPHFGAGACVLDPGDADLGLSHTQSRAVLRIEFEHPSLIQNLEVGLLFDGPEYADWEEAARFDVSFAGAAAPQRFTLHTSFVDAGLASCSWDGSATPWVSSGAWSGGPGLWFNADPFAGRAITRFDLHATHVSGADDDPLAPKTTRSDYVFRSLVALASPDAAILARLTEEIGGGDSAARRIRA